MRFFRGRYAEAVEVADAFFNEHYETDRNRVLDQDYKGFFTSAHMYAGHALKQLQRYSEALDHFRWVVEMAASTPPLRREQTVVPAAYAQICWILVKMGVPREEVQQEVDACLAQYPANPFTSALLRLRDRQ
jgi:tetratricopeptide (TPR) repeat protein